MAHRQPNKYPFAEKAKSGRSKCCICAKALAKDSVRICVQRLIETPNFTGPGKAYLHIACMPQCPEIVATEEVFERLQKHSPELWAEIEADVGRLGDALEEQRLEQGEELPVNEKLQGVLKELDRHDTYALYDQAAPHLLATRVDLIADKMLQALDDMDEDIEEHGMMNLNQEMGRGFSVDSQREFLHKLRRTYLQGFAAQTTRHRVEIDSEPATTVCIDDDVAGRTPFKINLVAGLYKLLFITDGGKVHQQQIMAGEGNSWSAPSGTSFRFTFKDDDDSDAADALQANEPDPEYQKKIEAVMEATGEDETVADCALDYADGDVDDAILALEHGNVVIR